MPDFNFDDMGGEELDFYGVDGNCFKLDDVVYEAVEYTVSVEIEEAASPLPPFGLPIGRIVIEVCNEDDFEGYKLVDLHDNHCWLRFGTEYLAPWHVHPLFEYTPKATQEL